MLPAMKGSPLSANGNKQKYTEGTAWETYANVSKSRELYITNNATYVFPCTLSNVITVHCDVRYLNCISRGLLRGLNIKIMIMYMLETLYYPKNSVSKALQVHVSLKPSVYLIYFISKAQQIKYVQILKT